jgi:solute carrier family 31 (copper transporter), member 1
MRLLLLLQLLAVAAVASLASAEHCFTKPTDPSCVDGSLHYSDSSLRADAEMACAAVPWASGCSLWRKCSTGLASGKYCEPWELMAAVCLDKELAVVEGCRRYRLLCPASRETVVKQCSDAAGVPNFLHTAGAIAAMQKLCTEMPKMKWCSECSSSNDPATNCRDPLSSIASICLDHYMSDCAPWYEMCKQLPKGLEVICGASGERAVDDDNNVCYGQMKMYFHHGMNDFVLFDSWVPCSTGRYVGALLAILVTGIFTGFLKGVRARLEQRWIRELDQEEPPAVPCDGSWGLLPSGRQRWWNFVRCCFVFVVVTLDYALMLAAMTFNIGIFFAGLATSHPNSVIGLRARMRACAVHVRGLVDMCVCV